VARLAVKVVPRAAQSEVVGWAGGRLRVRVAAPPDKGRANEALQELIAATLGVARRSVRIVGGHTSPQKLLEIDAIGAAELASRLPAPPG